MQANTITAQAEHAVKAIANYQNDPVIMSFVYKEALEKTAADICEKTKSGTTAKAVELLMIKNTEVKSRVDQYVKLGLVGCYFSAVELGFFNAR